MKNVNLQDTAKTKTAEDIRQRYNLEVIKSMTSKQTNSGYAIGIGKKAAVSKGLDIAGEIVIDDKITTANGYFDANGAQICPPGMSFEWNSDTIPTGYLEENGAAVSRTTYAGLFAVIGTTFGVGNGSTTFNLPNSGGKVAVSKTASGTFGILGAGSSSALGEETHALSSFENGQHAHQGISWGLNGSRLSLNGGGNAGFNLSYGANVADNYDMIFTRYSGSGNAHNNIQPSIVKRKIIKY